ncbi:MAG: hypothetical protein PHN37_02820 [Candidatus Pacebacteria bacterium]|nr:hypothetical protein [Candidatus Paceibacterota bacterium]
MMPEKYCQKCPNFLDCSKKTTLRLRIKSNPSDSAVYLCPGNKVSFLDGKLSADHRYIGQNIDQVIKKLLRRKSIKITKIIVEEFFIRRILSDKMIKKLQKKRILHLN